MKCTLDKDINTCIFFDVELLECNNPDKCSFQDLVDVSKISNGYKRQQEKWFEKYYRK